ncbi:integrin alpha-2 [Ciona intestinalis]
MIQIHKEEIFLLWTLTRRFMDVGKLKNTYLFFGLSLIHFAVTPARTFNIQELSKSRVVVSPQRKSQFGYSISLHENDNGVWLLTGAPEYSANKNEDPEGALYSCLLRHKWAGAKVARERNCTRLDFRKSKLINNTEVIYSCNFEDCDLIELDNDDFDWTKTRSATLSDNTGPSIDHTYKGSSPRTRGSYLYIEASDTSRGWESAMVSTPPLTATAGSCLRFWYHMYGSSIGSLNVYAHDNVTGLVMVWNKDGPQVNAWQEGYATIINEYLHTIVFEAVKGKNWASDIAIDDIIIYRGQCPEDMNFEAQSLGATLARNPKTGQILSCAPNWKYNCSGEVHAPGMCYFIQPDLSLSSISLLSPCRTQVCNSGKLDLIFLIDESTSVLENDFDGIKVWLRNTISSFPIGEEYTQIGLATYSDNPRIIFHLNKYHKLDDIRKAVLEVEHTSGGTATGKAILYLTNNMFTHENGVRPNAKRLVVVLTDGKSQDDVIVPSRIAKESGIVMFAIGVGKVVMGELRAIASDPDRYVYKINDFSALESIRRELSHSIASLESQGKTSTKEQGQAGLSATFLGGSPIIGVPGLNDWSGGISYFISENETSDAPGVFTKRVVKSFEEILIGTKVFGTRNVSVYEESEIPPTSPALYNISKSTFVDTSSIVGIKIIPKVGNSTSGVAINGGVNVTPTKIVLQTGITTEMMENISSTANHSISPRTKRNLMQNDMDTDSALDVLGNKPTKSSLIQLIQEVQNHTSQKTKGNHSKPTAAAYTFDLATFFSFLEGSADNDEFSGEIAQNTSDWFQNFTKGTQVPQLTLNKPTATSNFYPKPTKSSTPKYLQKRSVNDVIKRGKRNVHLNDELRRKITLAYFGYSITTGVFRKNSSEAILVGAPRMLSIGAVYIVNKTEDNELKVEKEFMSNQMGSYFGYSLCAVDTNGDGIDEVFVGAPLWMDKNYDEGRVFVYISNETEGSITQREVVLSGVNEIGARFGFSFATPGDLNMDGFNDIVIGAPSTRDGDGAVFIYNGRPEGITLVPSQVIRASQKKKRPVYFSHSLFAGVDVDENGYNDIAVGAPGNDRVVILFSRPVIHVDLSVSASPQVINTTTPSEAHTNDSCNANGTRTCVAVKACFHPYGVSTPEAIILRYQFEADVDYSGAKPRGRFNKYKGNLKIISNTTACIESTLYLKLPIYKQLEPLIVSVDYKLSPKMTVSKKSALLDIFDANQARTEVTFTKVCSDSHCESDLRINGLITGAKKTKPKVSQEYIGNYPQGESVLALRPNQVLELDVTVSNYNDTAYDVSVAVNFNTELYLFQLATQEPANCMRIATSDPKNLNKIYSPLPADEGATHQTLMLSHRDPYMMDGGSCNFKLLFAVKENFTGGLLNFTIQSASSSEETNPIDNEVGLEVMVKYIADLAIQVDENNHVTFNGSEKQSILTFDDIGPAVVHTYKFVNLGPSLIPRTDVSVQWPTETPSQHDVLYLTNVSCIPYEACICMDLDILINPAQINTTEQIGTSVNRGVTDVPSFGKRIGEPKEDSLSLIEFYATEIDCTATGFVCEILQCQLKNMKPSTSVEISLNFRLWKSTFSQALIWKAEISSDANVSTASSFNIVASSGHQNKLSKKITTRAFNANFTSFDTESSGFQTPWWVYVAAICAGVALLLLTVLALSRLGFFKSKYKQHLEEEREWQYSYRHNMVEHYKVYDGAEATEEEKQKLSTFQRKLPQSPTL